MVADEQLASETELIFDSGNVALLMSAAEFGRRSSERGLGEKRNGAGRAFFFLVWFVTVCIFWFGFVCMFVLV